MKDVRLHRRPWCDLNSITIGVVARSNESFSMVGVLIIVPCGQRKIWDKNPEAPATVAKYAYIGSPFVVNRRFAEHFAEQWIILSAKYGFIDPDFLISGPYNVTFKKKSTNSVNGGRLQEQVRRFNLGRFDTVIGLGGKEYRNAIKAAFEETSVQLTFPFTGLPIGKALRATKRAIESHNPFGVTSEAGAISKAGDVMIHSREAVISAIEECDRLGRDPFLERYRFGRSRNYVLVFNGKQYDSKAIVGVAYGYENPNHGPLSSDDFSGGASTVQVWLERLRFEVRNLERERLVKSPD